MRTDSRTKKPSRAERSRKVKEDQIRKIWKILGTVKNVRLKNQIEYQLESKQIYYTDRLVIKAGEKRGIPRIPKEVSELPIKTLSILAGTPGWEQDIAQVKIEWNHDHLEIDESIFNMNQLDLLAIQGVEKVVLNNNMIEIEELRVLKIKFSRLSEIPNIRARKLELLDVSHNEIRDIPNTITELKKLRSVNLKGNNIKDIPDILNQMDSMENILI